MFRSPALGSRPGFAAHIWCVFVLIWNQLYIHEKKVFHNLAPTLNIMSGTINNIRPKQKIIASEKVTDPSNASVLALASHQAAASAATAKHLIAANLPSAPSPESIGESAVEKASGGQYP
jgi:hypothetical protein